MASVWGHELSHALYRSHVHVYYSSLHVTSHEQITAEKPNVTFHAQNVFQATNDEKGYSGGKKQSNCVQLWPCFCSKRTEKF